MKKEKCNNLPFFCKYLPFDLAIFIFLAKNNGIMYAIKSVLAMKYISLIKWFANHNKRFRRYLISKANSTTDLYILYMFLNQK